MQLRTITCPNCNAALPVHLANAEALSCGSCGSVLDLKSPELKILEKLAANKFPPNSFLKLGMVGKFAGESYQIIGRICYRSDLYEWDTEDKEYSKESWPFDSWILVNDNKQYRYISEDREGYYFSEPFTPTAPSIPKSNQQYFSLFSDRPPQLILEKTDSWIDYFEGEFTWRPKLKDRTSAVEYRDGNYTYEVSWNYDEETREKKEVEFFRSRELSKKYLADCFDRQDIVSEEIAKEQLAKQYKNWSFAFVGLLLFLGFLFLTSLYDSAEPIFSKTIPISALTQEGTILGPFKLEEIGAIHSLRLRSDIPDNSWSWGAIELLDGLQEPINASEHEFWRESGYDSDGRWSESSLEDNKYFRLESPGDFYVRVLGEKGSANSGKIVVSVLKGVTLSRFYMIALIFSGIIAVILSTKAKSIDPKSFGGVNFEFIH